MRLQFFLIFLIHFATAQQDQVLVGELVQPGSSLRVTTSIIFDENLPLRFDVTQSIINYQIGQLINDNEEGTNLIEVFHPAILERFVNVNTINFTHVGMRRFVENSFVNCGNLSMVVFSHDLIEEIPSRIFRNCARVIVMNLHNNRISQLHAESFYGLSTLSVLALEGNLLTSIEPNYFSGISTLTNLWLSENPIEELHVGAFPSSLQQLNIIDCKITELHPEIFYNLTLLNALYLTQNEIEVLPPGVFTQLRALRFLHLEETKIRRLNSNSFGNLPSLTFLTFYQGALDEIQHGFFTNFPSLTFFDARFNLCANAPIPDANQVDFDENEVLHQCFAHWFVPRVVAPPVQPPADDNGVKSLTASWILIGILIIGKFI